MSGQKTAGLLRQAQAMMDKDEKDGKEAAQAKEPAPVKHSKSKKRTTKKKSTKKTATKSKKK